MVIALSACASHSQPEKPQSVTLTSDWVVTGLDSPESIIPSADETFLYVSNVNGEGAAKDGNGYISKISLDGKIIDKVWASGLDAPKGLALSGNTLYVTDINDLVLINTNDGKIKSRIPAENSGFLNDTVISPLGVLASDSANARIYRYVDGTMQIWLENDLLSGINGLVAQENRLLVTTMDKGEVISIDWSTKALEVIGTDMKNADGLAELDDGSFIVSSWPGILYSLRQGTAPTVLLDTQSEPIYMNDFYIMGDKLIVPNWQPGSLRSYSLQLSSE